MLLSTPILLTARFTDIHPRHMLDVYGLIRTADDFNLQPKSRTSVS